MNLVDLHVGGAYGRAVRRPRLVTLVAVACLIAGVGYVVGRQMEWLPGTGTTMTAVGVWRAVGGLDDIARASPDFATAANHGLALVELLKPPDGTPTMGGGVDGSQPLQVTQIWESRQSLDQLHAWLVRQSPGGLAIAPRPSPSPTPGATQAPVDAEGLQWVVPADARFDEGLLTAHVDSAGSGSRLTVTLRLAWVDRVPARFQGRPTQPTYTVTDAASCPRMPSRPWLRAPAFDGEPPDGVEGAVNTGYDVARQLLPDGDPTAALQCSYAHTASSGDVERSSSHEQHLDAAAAATLARRLRSLPTAQLHQDAYLSYRQDLDSTGYIIFSYPGRGPVTLSFDGHGVTNGTLFISSPATGTTSPLYPQGTAEIDDLFRWR